MSENEKTVIQEDFSELSNEELNDVAGGKTCPKTMRYIREINRCMTPEEAEKFRSGK